MRKTKLPVSNYFHICSYRCACCFFCIFLSFILLIVSGISEATVLLVSPADIREGADLILRCVVDGSEDVKYEWYR